MKQKENVPLHSEQSEDMFRGQQQSLAKERQEIRERKIRLEREKARLEHQRRRLEAQARSSVQEILKQRGSRFDTRKGERKAESADRKRSESKSRSSLHRSRTQGEFTNATHTSTRSKLKRNSGRYGTDQPSRGSAHGPRPKPRSGSQQHNPSDTESGTSDRAWEHLWKEMDDSGQQASKEIPQRPSDSYDRKWGSFLKNMKSNLRNQFRNKENDPVRSGTTSEKPLPSYMRPRVPKRNSRRYFSTKAFNDNPFPSAENLSTVNKLRKNKGQRGEPTDKAQRSSPYSNARKTSAKRQSGTTSRSSNSPGEHPNTQKSSSQPSKVQRFFEEEQARLRRKQEKKEQQKQTRDGKDDALRHLQRLNEDINKRWEAYQSKVEKKHTQAPKPRQSSFHTDSPFKPQARRSNQYSNLHQQAAQSSANTTLTQMSVKDLKRELRRYGAVGLEDIVEKSDLIARVEQYRQKRQAELDESAKQKEQEKMKVKIVADVERWSKSKTLHRLLNEVNGYKSTDERYLRRNSGFTPVKKAYRKAMLKIHPDKHMNDFEAHLRATEMFKEVTAKFTLFRQKHGKV